ncbi:MAG: hypothetical protein AAFV29_21075, partial [Myxococcota bacterium]
MRRFAFVLALIAGSQPVVVSAVCGDGTLEPGEACDDGNLTAGDCCNPFCQLEPIGTVCRAASGACDVEEACTGLSAICPADSFVAVGT